MDHKKVRYPIYIISKGRAYNPITAKMFLKENIDFTIAVEPQEYDEYCKTIPQKYVRSLPFKNLGLGSYPARNWCWDDSIKRGFDKHFLFDDNIYNFKSLNAGKREHVTALKALSYLEDFADQFIDLAICGYNYSTFITKATPKAFFMNTHVYSGMLIKNNIPFRWRLKYNEDVDLCLQVLHAKLNTVCFNKYTITKVSTTAKMKGGNQDELYKNNAEEKKFLKSKSLQMIWPQYVNVTKKYDRWHHQVSWQKFFKHPLKRKITTITSHNEVAQISQPNV